LASLFVILQYQFMWFPEPAKMALQGGATAFLLQTWQEFFDSFTPDSYQPRLHHTASLIDELEDIASRAVEDSRWDNHVVQIKNELKQSSISETGFLDGLPAYQWTIDEILKLSKAREIVRMARVLKTRKEEYVAHTSTRLHEVVLTLPRTKDDARSALHRLATVYLRSGRLAEQALELVTEENLHETPSNIAAKLLASLADHSASFRCILALRGGPSAVQHIARKVGFSLLAFGGLPESPETSDFANATEGAVLIEISREAPFPSEAAKIATRELRHAIELYNFYCHGTALELIPKALVTNPLIGKCWIIAPGAPALRRLKPRKNTVRLTHGTLDEIDAARLTGYMRNALEHCSLAHSSTTQKIQFVNMWSAMECLASSSKQGSVFGRISEVVVPIVVWRRIEKLLRYVAISLHTFRENGAARDLGGSFPPGKSFISPGWLMLTLARPKNHADLVDLFDYASPHPLLCHRIKMLWETLSDPRKLAAELTQSEQRLEWHLARIYRARNLIVHHGVEAPHMSVLLDHLHFYFSITLSRVLHGMRLHNDWNPDESITYWRNKSAYMIDGLKNFPSRLRVSDIFSESQGPSNHSPWP
jgi:hypothetical protein